MSVESFFHVLPCCDSLDDDELAGVRLEFSGQGELSPKEFEEELERKREEYQSAIQPFYRQCKKNGVKLEAKLAVGYDAKTITVEKAQKFNPRWIILDSHLKRDKVFIYGHVACSVAVMKEKGVATLMPSRGLAGERFSVDKKDADAENKPDVEQDECNDLAPDSMWVLPTLTAPQSPCWYPLSWRSGFPKVFSFNELEVMTNGFSKENVMVADEDKIVYDGICQETPVLIKKFSAEDDQALSLLKILSRVRHRNIFNLVGYCCTHDILALLFDYPCSGALKTYLQSDESAKNLSWKARWSIALDIGAAIRYLHEECIDGPIVDVFLDSRNVVICHGSSSLLNINHKAKWLKHDSSCGDLSQEKCQEIEKEKRLSADVSAFGILLVELITGKSEQPSEEQGEGYLSLVDWALPLLENGLLSEVIDRRLVCSTDSAEVDKMVRAALLCLNKDSGNRSMISENVFSLPLLTKRLLQGLMDPDRFRINYETARCIGLMVGLMYQISPLDFIPTERHVAHSFFELCATSLVFLFCLVGICRRALLVHRTRRMAAAFN